MQDQQSFISKTFQFLNQLTGKITSYSIQMPYIPRSREIHISRAISNICSLGLNLNDSHIFYMDFTRKLYVHLGFFPFKQEIYLKYELFLDSAIKIRFRKITPDKSRTSPHSTMLNQAKQNNPPHLKKKVKERTIREARDYVIYWRNLYEQVDNKGKRIYTLESASLKVGLAKKTLDDYYYQLRQGQYYGFKFEENLDGKIGILRRFIRQKLANEGMKSQSVTPNDDIDQYLASSDSDEDHRYK